MLLRSVMGKVTRPIQRLYADAGESVGVSAETNIHISDMPPIRTTWRACARDMPYAAGTDESGTWQTVFYAYEDGSVFWQLRTLYMLALVRRQARIDVHKEVKRDSIAWQVFGQRVGIDIEAALSHSRRQVQARGDDGVASDKTRAEITIRTDGLIVVLLQMGIEKRRSSDRLRMEGLLRALVHAGVPGETKVSQHLDDAICRAARLCGDNADEPCAHLLGAKESSLCEGHSASWCSCLLHLASMYLVCEACCSVLRSLIQVVVDCISHSLPATSETDPLTRVQLRGPSGRRLRIDEDLKRRLTIGVVQRREAHSGAAVAAALGIDSKTFRSWAGLEMGAYQTACWRHFASLIGVFGVAEDATRLGSPAEETVCYELYHPYSKLACVLPNQVVV